MTTEFSYPSSEMNSNPTSTFLLGAQSALTDIENMNNSQHLPVQRQLSVPMRKQPRDDYDRLCRVSTASGTMMVLQNEPSTPLISEEDIVIENIYRDDEEGVSR